MARRPASHSNVAVGYLRVSGLKQDLGPDAQRRMIEQWAAARGVTIVAVFEDRLTGVTPHEERPGMLAALAAIQAHGAGILLAAKRDRLGRDDKKLGIIPALERAVARLGARIVTADGSDDVKGATRVLVHGMSDVVAAFERAVISERTTAALAVKRSRGERVGQVPYGYRLAADGVHLEAEPREQDVLATVRELRAQGLSTYAIASRVTALGHVSRTGRSFQQTQIVRMLKAA